MPQRLIKGTYIGPMEKLKGKEALIRYNEDDELLAQFDDMHVKLHGRYLGFNWHKFDKEHFKIRKVNDKGDGVRLPKEGKNEEK